jgi:hypothetical protein
MPVLFKPPCPIIAREGGAVDGRPDIFSKCK